MSTVQLHISAMTCQHCADSAQDALNALPGVRASVSLAEQTAHIEHPDETPVEALIEAVTAKGYGARVLENIHNDGKQTPEAALKIAIIGTGSAAFAAAIRAAQDGAQVTLIEGQEHIGGTCVNVGCVPSKIMIRAAHIAHLQNAHAFQGVPKNKPIIDRAAMLAQQQARVDELRQAKYEDILSNNARISLVRGWARFENATHLIVSDAKGGEQRIEADYILIASGSQTTLPDIPGLSDTPYWTSTEALQSDTLPQRMIVLGGSVVALELAQAFSRLGSQVSVIARSTLLSKTDPALGESLKTILEEEGIEILLQQSPKSVQYEKGQFCVELEDGIHHGDALLVATGRSARTHNLDLHKAGVKTNEQGAIIVDAHMRSSSPSVFAAGDCTTQPNYVYVAAAAGTRAAINMLGGDAVLDLQTLPAVVFTDPQVATVGLTEQQAQAQGKRIITRTLPLDKVPRALANFDTRGFIKLIAEQDSSRLLGAQVLAGEGGEIIQSAALALHNNMTVNELAGQLFPYLTQVEGLKLCAQTFTQDVNSLSCCAG